MKNNIIVVKLHISYLKNRLQPIRLLATDYVYCVYVYPLAYCFHTTLSHMLHTLPDIIPDNMNQLVNYYDVR